MGRRLSAAPAGGRPKPAPVETDNRWADTWPVALELAGSDVRRLVRCPDGSVIVRNNPVQSD